MIQHAKNKKWKKRLLISTPTLGLIRYEWAQAKYSQVIPVNWESAGFDCKYDKSLDFVPLGFSIDDAYNLIVDNAIKVGVEWLLIIEDDVVIPHDCYLKMAGYMDKGDIPIVTGLYYLKASPTMPLIFRGHGNGAFTNFKVGSKVWVDGIPMGCLLVHMSVLKLMWKEAEFYTTNEGNKLKKIFDTPRKQFIDPETLSIFNVIGTQDLDWCKKVIDGKVLKRSGWDKVGRRKYPFLCDTSIRCKHIDINTGIQYP
jgi:hypothetical protein